MGPSLHQSMISLRFGYENVNFATRGMQQNFQGVYHGTRKYISVLPEALNRAHVHTPANGESPHRTSRNTRTPPRKCEGDSGDRGDCRAVGGRGQGTAGDSIRKMIDPRIRRWRTETMNVSKKTNLG
ncbi:hypothetical protein AXG93_154s1030 [Marchantia polymorpha subsp. ruderalis]|uniref:Uncharacterized protein n=1 Tax=Marchantia polymorpha subsp. ruderalis TaxID=1480154 RepID=A0A176VI60_MARPO|nr:hypothetical protein AXG93_154s1030 [Marchantia polymorpha subsp. ruderalis]